MAKCLGLCCLVGREWQNIWGFDGRARHYVRGFSVPCGQIIFCVVGPCEAFLKGFLRSFVPRKGYVCVPRKGSIFYFFFNLIADLTSNLLVDLVLNF